MPIRIFSPHRQTAGNASDTFLGQIARCLT
jgi:hypothetical protein